MPRAFILTVADSYWVEMVSQLKRDADLEVLFWSGHRPDYENLSRLFPNCIIHDTNEDMLMQGPAHQKTWSSLHIDAKIGAAMAQTERTALMMMDRMDPTGTSLPYRLRHRHFRRLVNYWGGVLKDLKPDIILFQISPHMIFDYVAYELAKLFGIRTLMFERSGLPGHALLVEQFEDLPVGLEQAYASSRHSGTKPSASGLDYIARCSGRNEESVPPLFEAKMNRLGLAKGGQKRPSLPGSWQVLKRELRQLYYFYRRNGVGRQDIYWVPEGALPETAEISLFRLALLRWRGRRRQKQLRKTLAARVQAVNPVDIGPYILLTLHYQPERATLPLGDVYSDQVNLAAALADTLPKGWKLLIKEHPWQLAPYSRGFLQRDPSFYEDLSNIENAILIDPDFPTDTLIDNARAVATITGSAGWQAICRGIPALVFGAAWYRACVGAYRVRDYEDICRAVEEIEDGVDISADDVEAFIDAIEKLAIRAVLEPKGEAQPNVDRKKNAQALAEAIITTLRPAKASAAQ